MSAGPDKLPRSTLATDAASTLSRTGCWLILTTAFLGWMCAGWQMAITSLAMREATKSLLVSADEPGEAPQEAEVAAWFGRATCAFLLGAAFGGYVLGWAGDRFGRTKAMAGSILCYSIFSAAGAYARTPEQLVALRFLACMGVGGMWPNGIALVSEAWPNFSRPVLAGAIGTSANLGIMLLSSIATRVKITVHDWTWVMWFGATPAVIGLFVLFVVPESPRWLAQSRDAVGGGPARAGLAEIFRPPILATTILGIVLGTIPLFGGWGCSNWASAWASEVGERINDPGLKAQVMLARSLPGTISSLLGGGLAALMGRRTSYFALSALALASAEILFCFMTPDGHRTGFLVWFAALGFFSGFFFGWLPLCLPELFPTRVRATGAGVSFNWGRVLTALGVIAAAELSRQFSGDYARIGQVTSLIYLGGLLVVFFLPDTSHKPIQD